MPPEAAEARLMEMHGTTFPAGESIFFLEQLFVYLGRHPLFAGGPLYLLTAAVNAGPYFMHFM